MTTRRRLVLGVTLALLLIPAIQPLLSGEITCGYDNGFHIWRAWEIEQLLQQGTIYSRWAPNMAQGLGYPLFNFSAPASAYGPALLHLAGMSWEWALNMAFVAGWIASALTMFLLARDLFGPRAGVVAAVAYAYAPFHAYDVFNRSGLSQASAWFLPPLILWALRRADRRTGFATTTLATAGLMLTHSAFALLFIAISIAYLPVVWHEKGRTTALWAVLAIILGLGASAFFWAPTLAELGLVQSQQLGGAWVFEYRNNFLPLDQLLPLPRNADPTLANDWPQRGLGLVLALTSLTGVLLGLRSKESRLQIMFFGAALAITLVLTLSISQFVWEGLPLLQRIQFPWRMLGPASLAAAVLTGAAANALPSSPKGRSQITANMLGFGLVVIIPLLHLGWFYPDRCSVPPDLTGEGMALWERQTGTIGTTALGEFLPIWVEQFPDENSVQEVTTPQGASTRLDASSIPDGAQVLDADILPTEARLTIESPLEFQARYLGFYYPGWRVAIDGDPVAVTPSDRTGLLEFTVPAGQHTLAIEFGETTFRLAMDIASGLAMALLALVLFKIPIQPSEPASAEPAQSYTWFLLGAILLVAAKLGLADRIANPLRWSNLAGQDLRRVDVSTQAIFDGQLRLLGYDAVHSELAGDAALPVQLYWQDISPGGPDYRFSLALKDGAGISWNESYLRPSRWHRAPLPTFMWTPDTYSSTAYEIQPLAGIPPGTYTMTVGVFDRATLSPYPAAIPTPNEPVLEIPLAQVEVTRPQNPFTAGDIDPQHTSDIDLGSLSLAGYNLDRTTAAPGDPFLLTLFWRADEEPSQDLRAKVQLIDPQGQVSASFQFYPVGASLPTSDWTVGDLWRGQHLLRLPAALESGEYRWRLGLCAAGQNECRPLDAQAALGTITIQAPERTFDVPELDLDTNVTLGNLATLLGADIDPGGTVQPGATLTVTLAWRAEAEMATSYRVFLHLLGPDETLVTQSDGEPADWSRPTTGWLPGEIVLDTRVLNLPPDSPTGRFTIAVGMYTLELGNLTTGDGLERVVLHTIDVVQP